jgi:hypothetical protein
MSWKKYSDFGGGQKNNLIQGFFHSGILEKKIRASRDKK